MIINDTKNSPIFERLLAFIYIFVELYTNNEVKGFTKLHSFHFHYYGFAIGNYIAIKS